MEGGTSCGNFMRELHCKGLIFRNYEVHEDVFQVYHLYVDLFREFMHVKAVYL